LAKSDHQEHLRLNNSENTIDSALLDAILNTAIDAIVTIDDRGIIQHANGAVRKLFGYAAAELIGKNISVLMPEPDRSNHDGYISTYQRTRQRKIIGIGRQVLGQRADGSLIPLDLAISEVRVDDRVLYTGIMRDMTERHQTEANLREAQQQLIQSERLAAIGQMMTGIAHESRNALQRSRACLDMLNLDLESRPDQTDLVRRTQAALAELQTLYEEVRSYAAPIQLEKSQHNIAHLCSDVWNHLASIWQSNELEHTIESHGDLTVKCDGARITQVLRNIYENAIAVSTRRGKLFTCCEIVTFSALQHLRITISDNGPGLNSEQRDRIFQPFFTTKTKGTGLGMAISMRIVEAHGGRIFVGKENDRHVLASGAAIVIELPIETSDIGPTSGKS
jgi:two-component system, LuxR family, sensor kinase FixL